jgi:AcrR family transcriptional regulator
MAPPRVRRRPEDAKREILEAAEQLLIDGGPHAVQVRAVAQRVAMTDAGVAHHFGSRDALLVALLRHGGRRIRQAVDDATQTWVDGGAKVDALVTRIATVYEDGYAELAVALHAAGWRDKGSGILDPVVDLLHDARRDRNGRRPSRSETRLAVAALHQALAMEPVYGAAFRRSAGIGDPAASRSKAQLAWWTRTLRSALEIEEPRRIASALDSVAKVLPSCSDIAMRCEHRSLETVYVTFVGGELVATDSGETFAYLEDPAGDYRLLKLEEAQAICGRFGVVLDETDPDATPRVERRFRDDDSAAAAVDAVADAIEALFAAARSDEP